MRLFVHSVVALINRADVLWRRLNRSIAMGVMMPSLINAPRPKRETAVLNRMSRDHSTRQEATAALQSRHSQPDKCHSKDGLAGSTHPPP